MNPISITSTESFIARAQRSEATRVVLWIMVLAMMIALTLTRRWSDGAVMSHDEVFLPYMGVLLGAAACQAALLWVLLQANRSGARLSAWVWKASAAFDLAVVAALLLIVGVWSPRGPIAALSAPPLLLMPLVVLLSVLRLRPAFTLVIGLAGAAFHVLLATRAMAITDALPEARPVYLSYGAILAMTGVAGMFVSRQMRSHVRESVDEAAAHERADRRIADMHRDLAVAREIQLGLLPSQSPKLAGFDITGMNRPADQTGGDYYDWLPLPDGRLAVMLGDVTGHGIGPALMMAVCRAYARATASTSTDPAALLTKLNELLHPDLSGGRFITFALSVFSETGAAMLISAGHGPTLLYRAALGEVSQFGGDGYPLGVSPGESYGPTTPLVLDEGDVLLMLTDGFFEWARPKDGEAFGIRRLREALKFHAAADAPSILQSIDLAVRDFCEGSPQSDDMTAVVIKRTAPAAPPDVSNQNAMAGGSSSVGGQPLSVTEPALARMESSGDGT